MSTIRSVAVVVVVAAAVVVVGVSSAGASPPDVARVTSVQASATKLRVGDTFTLTAGARDEGSTDYQLAFVADWSALNLANGALSCAGTFPDEPSADGPVCYFDDFTTTKTTTSHITGTFEVTPATPSRFTITVCAASFTNPPSPFRPSRTRPAAAARPARSTLREAAAALHGSDAGV